MEETVKAQCPRCNDTALRKVDADAGDESATLSTLDTCPRCGHDKVLTASVTVIPS